MNSVVIVLFAAVPATLALPGFFYLLVTKYGLALWAYFPMAYLAAVFAYGLGVWSTRTLWAASRRPVQQHDVLPLIIGIVLSTPLALYFILSARALPWLSVAMLVFLGPALIATLLILSFKSREAAAQDGSPEHRSLAFVASNWPTISALLGAILLGVGYVYDLSFAGIPYQDPTPKMTASFSFHSAIASWIYRGGFVTLALGAGGALLRGIIGVYRPSNPT